MNSGAAPEGFDQGAEFEVSLPDSLLPHEGLMDQQKGRLQSRDQPLSDLSVQELRALLERMPKVELHRHLEGALSVESILKIAEKHEIELPTTSPAELRPLVCVTKEDRSLVDFLQKFHLLSELFVSLEAIESIAYEGVQAAAEQNIKYIEMRYAPMYLAEPAGLDPEQVVEAVIRGMNQAASDFDIEVHSILIVERHRTLEEAYTVGLLAEDFMERGVVGIDLAGDESNFPGAVFEDVFRRAKEAGLGITIHAGEAAGPESVREAIEVLGAERIGHAVSAAEDAALLDEIESRGITLELCPGCNLQTGAVASLAEHPMPQFLRRGLLVGVNTDDPGVCANELSDEFEALVQEYGLSFRDLRTLLLVAAHSSFAGDFRLLRSLDQELEALWAEFSS